MHKEFQNEEDERRTFHDELTSMKEEIKLIKMGSNCTVSSAASTGIGPGSGTHARPPLLAARWVDAWVLRKLEVKGWVMDWSQKRLIGMKDD